MDVQLVRSCRCYMIVFERTFVGLLQVLEAYNVQSATAVATTGQSVSSNSSCNAPHCEQVYAAIKAPSTASPPAAGGG